MRRIIRPGRVSFMGGGGTSFEENHKTWQGFIQGEGGGRGDGGDTSFEGNHKTWQAFMQGGHFIF